MRRPRRDPFYATQRSYLVATRESHVVPQKERRLAHVWIISIGAFAFKVIFLCVITTYGMNTDVCTENWYQNDHLEST